MNSKLNLNWEPSIIRQNYRCHISQHQHTHFDNILHSEISCGCPKLHRWLRREVCWPLRPELHQSCPLASPYHPFSIREDLTSEASSLNELKHTFNHLSINPLKPPRPAAVTLHGGPIKPPRCLSPSVDSKWIHAITRVPLCVDKQFFEGALGEEENLL